MSSVNVMSFAPGRLNLLQSDKVFRGSGNFARESALKVQVGGLLLGADGLTRIGLKAFSQARPLSFCV